jgi:hypothetical protein
MCMLLTIGVFPESVVIERQPPSNHFAASHPHAQQTFLAPKHCEVILVFCFREPQMTHTKPKHTLRGSQKWFWQGGFGKKKCSPVSATAAKRKPPKPMRAPHSQITEPRAPLLRKPPKAKRAQRSETWEKKSNRLVFDEPLHQKHVHTHQNLFSTPTHQKRNTHPRTHDGQRRCTDHQ